VLYIQQLFSVVMTTIPELLGEVVINSSNKLTGE